MKTLLSLLLGLCVATFALADAPTETGTPKRTPEELEKLLAPIALYPDSLVALILPAATNYADVVLAARYLASGGDVNEVSSRSWDESVKSLVHYPDVVKWLDENLEWTRELGAAFALQPADIMTTLQKLRADARSRGLLTDTPQQKVVVQEDEISIVPAADNVIYVPAYDPEILIVRERPAYNSWLTFSTGFAVGSWLYYDCDWRSRSVWVYHRPPGWTYRSDWRWHHRGSPGVVYTPWRPSPVYWRHVHRAPPGGYRPVPGVRPPSFVNRGPSDHRWGESHDGRRGDSNDHRWDGRRDHRPGDNRAPANARHSDDRDRRNNFAPRRSQSGVIGRATEPSASVAPIVPTQPNASSGATTPTQGRRQWSEGRSVRPREADRDRTYRHAINNPPVQTGVPSPNRPTEAAVPRSYGRMNGGGQRESNRSSAPVTSNNNQGSSAPAASSPSAPATSNNNASSGGQRTGYGNGNRYQVLP